MLSIAENGKLEEIAESINFVDKQKMYDLKVQFLQNPIMDKYFIDFFEVNLNGAEQHKKIEILNDLKVMLGITDENESTLVLLFDNSRMNLYNFYIKKKTELNG